MSAHDDIAEAAITDTTVIMRTDGVSVVLDVLDAQLPAILHWGADIGPLEAESVDDLRRAGQGLVADNQPDEPIRLALVPEALTGWTGRPGLSGSRAGRDWSPKFVVGRVIIDGRPMAADERIRSIGTGLARFEAYDPQARLGLDIEVELLPGGVLRSRATVVNTDGDPYQLDDLVLAYPVPGRAREILDFGGRWAKERTPQRRELVIGTHLREGRHGRTGPDAATVLHLGVPGFGFAGGEIWSVHTGWSGHHTHYAERTLNGLQLIGGGELLLPGR